MIAEHRVEPLAVGGQARVPTDPDAHVCYHCVLADARRVRSQAAESETTT